MNSAAGLNSILKRPYRAGEVDPVRGCVKSFRAGEFASHIRISEESSSRTGAYDLWFYPCLAQPIDGTNVRLGVDLRRYQAQGITP